MDTAVPTRERHPKGLYVLFAAEMWERFSFYSMLALFVLYLRDPNDGFGWTAARATETAATYLMFVYASPLVGGLLADLKLGYRRAVIIGAVFFMAGHLLLSFKSETIMYVALACLVVGNGFFKPNVSTMVGNLYPEGSKLKDSAYNIFYLGINVGAFLSGICAEAVKAKWGNHPAFAMAAIGMLISIIILVVFKRHITAADRKRGTIGMGAAPAKTSEIDAVPESRRIMALIIIFIIVIVFWMAFHQNSSTLLYWANDNTDWNVSGTLSSSINPFFILTLTFPLLWFWKVLRARGMEPSTPTKMAIGMLLVAASYYIMYFAGKAGGDVGRVSPAWLIACYAVITLGELMLSPMGLALVSKVAPVRMRGLMMGGWFLATAIGNKLTQIGVLWDEWLHSSFFALLATICVGAAILLFILIRPLKRSMPGV